MNAKQDVTKLDQKSVTKLSSVEVTSEELAELGLENVVKHNG